MKRILKRLLRPPQKVVPRVDLYSLTVDGQDFKAGDIIITRNPGPLLREAILQGWRAYAIPPYSMADGLNDLGVSVVSPLDHRRLSGWVERTISETTHPRRGPGASLVWIHLPIGWEPWTPIGEEIARLIQTVPGYDNIIVLSGDLTPWLTSQDYKVF